MDYPVVDTADNTSNKLSQLKNAGTTAIIRYDHRMSGSWKQIYPAEARAIADHGLKLGIVYEGAGSTPSTFTKGSGYKDALYSRRIAPDRGQPKNSAIYFAVDFDASQSQVDKKIIPYFQGVNDALDGSGLYVGVYGSGLVCRQLLEHNLVTCTWPTCSKGFTGSRSYIASRAWHIWQAICDRDVHGLSLDFNEENAEVWGQFIPWGPEPDPPKVIHRPVPPPLHDTHWVQASLKTLGYDPGPLDGIMGPLTRQAVRDFQMNNDLFVDGICGPLTTVAIETKLPSA